MKTETNLYLRSLCGEKKSALREAHDEELRKLNDAITALRTDESQKQTPALSEETVESIRRLLKIDLDCVNEMSAKAKCMAPLIPSGEAQDNFILAAKVKTDVATKALKEFNAAYPEKPKSK